MINREIIVKIQRDLVDLTFEALVELKAAEVSNNESTITNARQAFDKMMEIRQKVDALLA